MVTTTPPKKNPIIERALTQGSKSGGIIGDISGGTGATVSVKSSSRGSSTNSKETTTPQTVTAEEFERIKQNEMNARVQSTIQTQENLQAKQLGTDARKVTVTSYGDIVKAPTSATVREDLIRSNIVEAQPKQDFVKQAEYPYGKQNQKVSVSQLKEMQV
jgi:hypothetical protein